MKEIKVVLLSEYNFARVVGEYLLEHGVDPHKVDMSDRWDPIDYANVRLDRWDPLLVRCVEQLGPRRSCAYVKSVTGPFIIQSDGDQGETLLIRDEIFWQNPWEEGSRFVGTFED